MGHVSPEAKSGVERRWLGVRRPLFVVGVFFFVAGSVLLGRQIWTNNDPLRLIQRGTPVERHKAAMDLGEIAEGRDIDSVIASLVRATEDRDAAVRTVAADSLSGVVREMLRHPASTPEEQAKYDARVALAVRTLTKALTDRDPKVRKSAVFGFGLLGNLVHLDLPPELIAALGDESRLVRHAALRALYEGRFMIGLVPGLMKALESPARDVRYDAGHLLGQLGPAAVPAVPALLAILKEPFDRQEREKTHAVAWDWDPACSAARSLVQISSSNQVIAGLIEALSSDVDERVSCAAEGLGTLEPKAVEAVPALIAAYDRASLPSTIQSANGKYLEPSVGLRPIRHRPVALSQS